MLDHSECLQTSSPDLFFFFLRSGREDIKVSRPDDSGFLRAVGMGQERGSEGS